ncbi:MAG: glycine cleavage system aminomethyltransferase GcvT [Halobacteriovoraceae bacterium]|nr:glycine cleavage system aminomethyltransferase GcvT [Halobacteriovoraceae bacterium]
MEYLKTALYHQHKKQNAKILPFAGFYMPIQYTSIKKEVLAVRQFAGMFDVSHMGELIVEGEDALKFVDYLITNDMKKAGVGKAVYSPLCRDNGTIIDDLIAYRISDKKILLCVNAANIKKDYNWMAAQVGNFDCRLSDCSDDYSLLAVQGPQAYSVVESMALLNERPSRFATKVIVKDGEEVIIARTGYTGEDGLEIFCSHSMALTLWRSLLDKKVVPCGLAARDVLRLEVGYPLYGHELNDTVTPLDTGLSWTVKFHKKDFMGKKVLMNYNPRFIPVKLSLEKGIPRENYKVLNEKEEIIGHVTSGSMGITINGKGIALASIKKEKYPENEKFLIEIRGKFHAARFHKKPFVIGGG